MAEWFFRKKSKGEVERDPGWDEYFTSNRSTDESSMRGKAASCVRALDMFGPILTKHYPNPIIGAETQFAAAASKLKKGKVAK